MSASARDRRVLSAAARALKRRNGCSALPHLLFFTDPARTPDPRDAAARLPPGAAIVYRHFGALDRVAVAKRLLRICRRRQLKLLIGADAALAAAIGADGVHLPERHAKRAGQLRRKHPKWIVTAATHGRATANNASALVLAPVFPSASRSALKPLGARQAKAIARQAKGPVYALGGVTAGNAGRLTGFAGLAAVDALA